MAKTRACSRCLAIDASSRRGAAFGWSASNGCRKWPSIEKGNVISDSVCVAAALALVNADHANPLGHIRFEPVRPMRFVRRARDRGSPGQSLVELLFDDSEHLDRNIASGAVACERPANRNRFETQPGRRWTVPCSADSAKLRVLGTAKVSRRSPVMSDNRSGSPAWG